MRKEQNSLEFCSFDFVEIGRTELYNRTMNQYGLQGKDVCNSKPAERKFERNECNDSSVSDPGHSFDDPDLE